MNGENDIEKLNAVFRADMASASNCELIVKYWGHAAQISQKNEAKESKP